MTKIERFAWQQLMDYLLSCGVLGVPNAIQALLDADEPAPEEPRYIPKGVPCVVWDNYQSDNKWLNWSCGDGTFVDDKNDVDEDWSKNTWSHARPVCFPEWKDVPEHITVMSLEKQAGVWVGVGYENYVLRDELDYYETRPEVTRD